MASDRAAVTRSDSAPSWEKLLAKASTEDYINGPNCISPSKERESVRLFGQKEADVRIVLYRDHANWCPYCHKVQLLIEAKKIPYMVKKINLSCYGAKPVEFLKLVPTGLLPVIQLDGKIITESMDIMFLLEETFQTPYSKMIPTDDNNMMQYFHRYMRLERVFIGAWLGALRGPLSMVNRGLEPVVHSLDVVESCLQDFAGPFFYPGETPSFVDINFGKLSNIYGFACDASVRYESSVGGGMYKRTRDCEQFFADLLTQMRRLHLEPRMCLRFFAFLCVC